MEVVAPIFAQPLGNPSAHAKLKTNSAIQRARNTRRRERLSGRRIATVARGNQLVTFPTAANGIFYPTNPGVSGVLTPLRNRTFPPRPSPAQTRCATGDGVHTRLLGGPVKPNIRTDLRYLLHRHQGSHDRPDERQRAVPSNPYESRSRVSPYSFRYGRERPEFRAICWTSVAPSYSSPRMPIGP
jgi:hypothetical protein